MSDLCTYLPSHMSANESISSTPTTVGMTDAMAGLDRTNLIASSAMVRPRLSAMGLSCSTFASADLIHSPFLTERWSFSSIFVPAPTLPVSMPDASGTLARTPIPLSAALSSSALPGVCSSMLYTVWTAAISGRSMASSPSSSHPMAGPSAAWQARTLPSRIISASGANTESSRRWRIFGLCRPYMSTRSVPSLSRLARRAPRANSPSNRCGSSPWPTCPAPSNSYPNFVDMTTSSRMPANALPISLSLLPAPYTSPVSKKFIPLSYALLSMRSASSSPISLPHQFMAIVHPLKPISEILMRPPAPARPPTSLYLKATRPR